MNSFARVLAPLALLGLAMPATGHAAQDRQDVTFADLDLSTKAGQDELKARLNRATKKVCFQEQQVGSRISSAEQRDCMRVARQQAQSQFDAIVERAATGG